MYNIAIGCIPYSSLLRVDSCALAQAEALEQRRLMEEEISKREEEIRRKAEQRENEMRERELRILEREEVVRERGDDIDAKEERLKSLEREMSDRIAQTDQQKSGLLAK